MRKKGLEPSLRWNWCLKPARLPFRHFRTELIKCIKFAPKSQFLQHNFIITSRAAHTSKKDSGEMANVKQQDRAHRKGWKRAKQAAAWLALLPVAALGWLYSRLPDRVYLTPGEVLALPRFSYVEPLGAHGSQNVASTRAVGSYQTTLSLGGWLPIKTIRTIVTERMQVTVCGTPFGVKMFSEGALVVGFSDVERPSSGTANPAKEAGLRLGDRVIRIGTTVTEDNDAVKAALEAAQGQAVEVVYIRNGEQLRTTLVPVWDAAAGQWRAGMWVRDSSAGVGTLTFADDARGIFAGLGHPISDSDTGESIALRTGEIVPCEITGCSKGTAGSPGELKGHFLGSRAIGSIRINGENGVSGYSEGLPTPCGHRNHYQGCEKGYHQHYRQDDRQDLWHCLVA